MSNFAPKTFTSPVSFKLDEDNFMPWKHQALACIKANKLKDHLNKKKIPTRYCFRRRSCSRCWNTRIPKLGTARPTFGCLATGINGLEFHKSYGWVWICSGDMEQTRRIFYILCEIQGQAVESSTRDNQENRITN